MNPPRTHVHGHYEWDTAKYKSNRRKHPGVAFEMAEGFEWETAAIRDGGLDENGEVREVAVGFIGAVPYVVCSTDRGARTRVISLRRATPKERAGYELWYQETFG